MNRDPVPPWVAFLAFMMVLVILSYAMIRVML